MKRRKRRNRHLSRIISASAFVSIILLFTFSVIRLDRAVRPSAQMQAEQLSKHRAYEIITKAVSRYIANCDCSYGAFSTIVYDESGNVSSVEALTNNINRVQSELALHINESIDKSGKTQAEIPLGNISGSYLLAGKGPAVKVGICPVGTAEVRLKSSFDSAGINQTRHRIYAEIGVDMKSSFPLYSFDTRVEFDYLIAETVIIGDVPDYSVKAWSDSIT